MATEGVVIKLSALADIKGVKQIVTGLGKMQTGAQKVQASFKRMATASSKNMGQMSNRLKGLVGGLLAVATVAKVVNTTIAFERQKNALTALSGSAMEAQVQMGKLSNVAKRTQFTTDQVTSAFIQLQSHGIGVTVERMEQLSAFASHAGASIDDVAKAMTEAERGGFGQLSNILGATVKNVNGRVFAEVNGQIVESMNGVDGFMKELAKIQGSDWAKSQKRNVESIEGAISGFKDAAQSAMLAIAAGFGGDVEKSIRKVTESIAKMEPALKLVGGVAAVFMDTLTGLMDVFDAVMTTVNNTFGEYELSLGTIEDWIGAIIIALGILKIAIAIGLAPLTAGVLAVAALGASLFGLLRWIQSADGETFMDRFRNRSKQVVDWVRATWDRFMTWWRGLFTSAFDWVDSKFGDVFGAIIGLITGDFALLGESIKGIFNSVVAFIFKQYGRIGGVVDKIGGLIGQDWNLRGTFDQMADDRRPTTATAGPRVTKGGSSVVRSNVGRVEVNIAGSTNMQPAEVGRTVSRGVDDALGRQTRKLQHNFAGT